MKGDRASYRDVTLADLDGEGTHRPGAASGGMTSDLHIRLDRLDRLASTLDSRYRIPLTPIRFGWDSILGLIPGLGDVAALGPAGYILLEAHRMDVPTRTKLRMAGNTGIDWLVGSVPLIGDIFDVGFKSNRRNIAILRDHFGVPATGTTAPDRTPRR